MFYRSLHNARPFHFNTNQVQKITTGFQSGGQLPPPPPDFVIAMLAGAMIWYVFLRRM
jgi:hypothetical protein